MLLATDFMCEALTRATSVLAIFWQSSPACPDVVHEGVGVRISALFTFAETPSSTPPRWLRAEASTVVSDDGLMALNIAVAVPLTAGGFVVAGELTFPDFHEVSAAMVDPAFISQQRAVTLDMVLRVFRAAREGGAHLGRLEVVPLL